MKENGNQSRRQENRRSQTKGKKRRWNLRLFIGILLILVAVALLALDPLKNNMIRSGMVRNQVTNISREEIVKNQEKEVSYNWDDIQRIDARSVFSIDADPDDLPVVGGIAMPDLGINLPIHKGTSEAGMFYGAGTLYEDQEMGESNYSLASHHSIHQDLLFAPLLHAEIGQTVYLTDLDKIYEYKVDFVETVPADRIDLTYPTEEAKVTLITCDSGLVNRFVVQGTLVNKVSIFEADKGMLDAFSLPETVPEAASETTPEA